MNGIVGSVVFGYLYDGEKFSGRRKRNPRPRCVELYIY